MTSEERAGLDARGSARERLLARTDIPELLARVRADQFDIDKLLEAAGIALMLREEAVKSGNLSLVSALEPLRHAVESVTADRAKP